MMGEDENADSEDDVDVLGGCEVEPGTEENAPVDNPLTKTTSNHWTVEEQQLFTLGMEQFGNRWSKISKLVGTKSPSQVRNHAKPYHRVKQNTFHEESPFDELRPLLQNRAFSDIVAEVVRLQRENDIDTDNVDVNDVDVDVNDSKPDETTSPKPDQLDQPSNDLGSTTNSEYEEDILISFPSECVSEDKVNSGESANSEEGNQGLASQDWNSDVRTGEEDDVSGSLQISDEERLANPEFFRGGPKKTPERYLMLREKIVSFWEQSRPQRLSKSVLRSKLGHCGDVNSIGKIYDYLQGAGTINFGCKYEEPKPRYKPSVKQSSKCDLNPASHMELRKRRTLSVRASDLGESGCTLEHGVDGQVVNKVSGSIVRTREGTLRPVRTNPFQLVPCSSFSSSQPAPFSVSVHLAAVLLMEIHAHCLQTEVIGLLGGTFYNRKRELHILSTAPCDSLSTDVECEMDPVSQALASEWLRSQGQQVVGWYHSHPTFAPTPSVRDLETQAKFQELFQWQSQQPFVSVILSPFLPSETSKSAKATSKFQYWLLGDNTHDQGVEPVVTDLPPGLGVPYCLRASLVRSEQKALSMEMLERLRELYQKAQKHPSRTMLNKKWTELVDVRYIDKLFFSLQCHIQKAGVSEDNMAVMLAQIEKVFNDREWW